MRTLSSLSKKNLSNWVNWSGVSQLEDDRLPLELISIIMNNNHHHKQRSFYLLNVG